jgi:hypothetical protein
MTFVRNHARAMLVCDFLVTVTARFQVLYVFVLMEIDTRRLVHFNVTAHPNETWTLLQFREAINDAQRYQFLIHDRDNIYTRELELGVKAMGVKVLKTPFRSPQANSYCEQLLGSITPGMSRFSDPAQRGSSEKTLNP